MSELQLFRDRDTEHVHDVAHHGGHNKSASNFDSDVRTEGEQYHQHLSEHNVKSAGSDSHSNTAATHESVVSNEHLSRRIRQMDAVCSHDSHIQYSSSVSAALTLTQGPTLNDHNSLISQDRTNSKVHRNDDEDKTKHVDELSKENASLRSRLKGVNILSTLLSEGREEIANLNIQKNKMEIAVENLQSRLHRLGADTSVDLADHEIFMPGHDKQFLNSLISENMRLQKALKSGAKDASEVVLEERQTERIKKLESMLQQVTLQKREKEKQFYELKELMKLSSEEKDRELVNLTEKVNKLLVAQDNAEAICESLTDQAEKLREQVIDAKKVSEASQFQKKQEEKQEESEKCEQEPVTKLTWTTPNLSLEEQIKIMDQQLEQLQKENDRMAEQLKEVIGMNSRWQRYNDQREAYVIKLSRTNYQLQSKVTVLEQRSSDLTKQNEELKKKNQLLQEEDMNKRDAALCSADQQLAMKDEEIKELKAHILEHKELISQLTDEASSNLEDDRERILMLEQQVNTFASDFKEERRDRERIQGLYTSALKELQDKDSQIEDLQKQLHHQGSRSPSTAYEIPPYKQSNRQIANCRQEMMMTHGMQKPTFYGADYHDGLPTDVEPDCGARDEPDGMRGLDIPRDGDFVDTGNKESGDDDPLQCPHCFRGFNITEVEKFMQHTDTCLEQS